MNTSPTRIFFIFLRLGLTSFGGPIAHIGFFRDEFVTRRRWLSEQEYADLVALCQFLPGPASSQVGISIGLLRCGYLGAVLAWLGFTLPSAIILSLCAMGVVSFGQFLPPELLNGLKAIAAAVVIQAIWGMAKILCVDYLRLAICFVAALFLIIFPSSLHQLLVLVIGAIVGCVFIKTVHAADDRPFRFNISKKIAVGWLTLFTALFFLLPMMAFMFSIDWLNLIDAYYRTGSLVFGGGHVVLPLLHSEMVVSNIITDEMFLVGYGIAQAVPGPLFTFAAYLGTLSNGWLGGVLALCGIFLPSFLLLFAVLPFWNSLRTTLNIRNALAGINAAVVGLLLAALYDPILTHTLNSLSDLIFIALAVFALTVLRWPAWLLIFVTIVATFVLPIAN